MIVLVEGKGPECQQNPYKVTVKVMLQTDNEQDQKVS